MSLDSSLKVGGGLKQHRNVLTRAERIVKLAEKDKFNDGDGNPLKLPKVGNRKLKAVNKKKAKGPDSGEEEAAT